MEQVNSAAIADLDRQAREWAAEGMPPLQLLQMPERVGRSLPEVLARLEVLAQASRNQMTNGQESHAPKQRVWQPPTEAAVRQLLRASGLMTKELQYSLSSARPPQGRYAHQAQAQALLREFLAEAEAGRQEWRVPSWGLVLQSREKGTGKSYLLQALVADLCRLGIPALFVVEGEMMEWLRRANKPCAEFGREQVRQRYWRAPVLVVDDLTTDKASEYSASELYLLVNDRLRNGRPLFATTQTDQRRMQARYDAVAEDQGGRIVSRLHGQAREWVTMEGPDVRVERGE